MNSDDGSRERPIRLHNLGLSFAALVLASTGVLVWNGTRARSGSPAPQTPASVPIQTLVAKPQAIEITRSSLGTLIAWNMAIIRPQVSGQLIDVPFQEGAVVKTGDVLARIDPRPFQAALDQAKARLAQDQANLGATEKNLWRDQTLLAKGGFATQQTVDNERAQVDSLKASIAGDQASIEAAQLNLDDATIKAPFTSVAGLRKVDVGNIVSPTSDLVTIAQIEPIAVAFTLPQADLAAVQAAARRGKPAVLALDQDGTTQLARGTLEVVNNQVDPATGTIKLKARFDNPDHKLWPGSFVQVRTVLDTEPNAIVIPSEAVQRGPDGPYVWTVADSGTAQMHRIELGAIQEDRTVVGQGLTTGDRVVVAGQYRLTQGARVTEKDRSVAGQMPKSRS